MLILSFYLTDGNFLFFMRRESQADWLMFGAKNVSILFLKRTNQVSNQVSSGSFLYTFKFLIFHRFRPAEMLNLRMVLFWKPSYLNTFLKCCHDKIQNVLKEKSCFIIKSSRYCRGLPRNFWRAAQSAKKCRPSWSIDEKKLVYGRAKKASFGTFLKRLKISIKISSNFKYIFNTAPLQYDLIY